MVRWRRWAALCVLVLPVLLISIDMTVLGFAVPALSESLSPSGPQLLWIVDIYSFLLAGLLVLMGNVGDRIGRRRLLMLGSAVFGVASLLAAFAPTAEWLLVARALLGVGGATLMPSTLSLIRTVFTDPRERQRAIAVWASSFAGGAAIGPVLGGWLLEHFWWGSVFLINVPVMVLLLAGAAAFLPESRNLSPGPFDILSALLSIAGMLAAVYALKSVGSDGPSLEAGATAVAAAVLLTLFVRRQTRVQEPLLDLELFRDRKFSVAVSVNLLSMLSFLALLFFLPQYLQLVLEMGAFEAGLWMVPMSVMTVAGALAAPRLADRLPLHGLIGGGMLVAAGGFACGVLLTPAGELGFLLAVSALTGLGVGVAETLTNDVIVATAPPERTGAAAAISETAYEFGGAIGTAVLGTLGLATYAAVLGGRFTPNPEGPLDADLLAQAQETLGGAEVVAATLPGEAATHFLGVAREAFTTGMSVVFVVAALVAAGAGMLALIVLRPAKNGAGRRSVGALDPEARSRHDLHCGQVHRET